MSAAFEFDFDLAELINALQLPTNCNPNSNLNLKGGGQECPPHTGLAGKFSRVFLLFPQASPILHSFCTTQHQFPIAIVFAFPHSAHSASVSCIEPAGDCGRAGGDRRFSRVNRREGFQKVRFGASQKTRALRPPQTVLPKKLDLSRPLPQSLRVKNPRIRVFG